MKVHGIREVLPGAGNARHHRLSAEAPSVPTSRATRVTSEANDAQLIDHRVDGILELQDLAAHIDGDLLGQVAVGDRDRDFGDVANLVRQIARPSS
jgi:hypothetical protein